MALASLSGCGSDATPAAKKRAPSVSVAARLEPVQRSGAEEEKSGLPDGVTNPPQTQPASKQPRDRAAAAQHPERIAILTPAGPLLVDVRLTIAGRPHTDAFQSAVLRVLDAADTDGDGRPTWQELAANGEFLKAESATAPPPGSRQMKTFIERYDENRDGEVQRGEAESWLGRDAGASTRAFALRSSRSYAPIPRATSRVWQLLDADRNGALSADEIRAAAQKLWALDGDDDRVITAAELATLREQLQATRETANVGREEMRYAALHLELGFDVERLQYLLSDLYAPRQSLGPDSFPGLPSVFKLLDANANDWLEQSELATMRTIAAHLDLAVAFDGQQATSRPTIEIRTLAPVLEQIAHPAADRLVLSLNGTRLILSAHDLSSPPDANGTSALTTTQAAQRAQVRVMVHDQVDALFDELDLNADGILGERDIDTSGSRLAARDANGDGELSGHELPYSMILAFLRAEPASQRMFYVPAGAPPASDEATSHGWFHRADFNGDGYISRREFLGSAEQFAQLDSDDDGYIGAAEAVAVLDR